MTPEIIESVLNAQLVLKEIHHRDNLSALDAVLSLANFLTILGVGNLPEVKTNLVLGQAVLALGMATVGVGLTFAIYNAHKSDLGYYKMINRLYEDLF